MIPENSIYLPLSDLQTGEMAYLVGTMTGRHSASRLASLGFTPGVIIQMTQNYGHGPLVVIVRGTRVALGRHEAAHILVQRSVS